MGWTYTAGPDRRTESNTGQLTGTGAGRTVWQCTTEYSVPGGSGMSYCRNSGGNGDDQGAAGRRASRPHPSDAKSSRVNDLRAKESPVITLTCSCADDLTLVKVDRGQQTVSIVAEEAAQKVGNLRIPGKSWDVDPCNIVLWQHGDNLSPNEETDTCASACAAISDHDTSFLRTPKDVCKCTNAACQDKNTYDLMDRHLCQLPLSNSELDGHKVYKETDSDGSSVDSVDACFSPFQTSCSTCECHTETSPFLNYGTSVDPVYDYDHQHQTEHDADCKTIPCQSTDASVDVKGYCQCLQECSDENPQTDISHCGSNSSQKSEGSSVDPITTDKNNFITRQDLDNEVFPNQINHASFCQCRDRRSLPLESDKNNAASASCQHDPVNVKTDFFCQCPPSGSYQQHGKNIISCVSILSSPGSLSSCESGSCHRIHQSAWVEKSYRVLLVEEGGRCDGNAASITKWLTAQQNANNSSNSPHDITTHSLCERLEKEHGMDTLRLNANTSVLGLPVGLVLGVATALLSKGCQI